MEQPGSATREHGRRAILTRGVVALFACLLLVGPLAESPVRATDDLAARISAARRSQLSYESAMLAQDRVIPRLAQRHQVARKALRQANRSVRRAKQRRAAARRRVNERSARLRQVIASWPPKDAKDGRRDRDGRDGDKDADEPDPEPTPAPKPPAAYLARVKKARAQLVGAKRTARRADGTLAKVLRARRARVHRLGAARRELRVAVGRRNAAAGALGGQIVSMTRLAQQRVSRMSWVRLGPGGDSFSWPADGSITQRYGCTGFALNPRRGSCRHFHDGIDMSANGGTAIRAVAEGVVAYIGWNPWDREGRAFIIVLGHPGGYVSRYGHLQPYRGVRVGQLVRRGDVIGQMGSTGNSTGVHLHMELLDRTGTVDPLKYFPVREQDAQVPERARKGKGKGKDKDRGADRGKDRSPRPGSSRGTRESAPKPLKRTRTSAGKTRADDWRRSVRRSSEEPEVSTPAPSEALELAASTDGPVSGDGSSVPLWLSVLQEDCDPRTESDRRWPSARGREDGDVQPVDAGVPGCRDADALELAWPTELVDAVPADEERPSLAITARWPE